MSIDEKKLTSFFSLYFNSTLSKKVNQILQTTSGFGEPFQFNLIQVAVPCYASKTINALLGSGSGSLLDLMNLEDWPKIDAVFALLSDV